MSLEAFPTILMNLYLNHLYHNSLEDPNFQNNLENMFMLLCRLLCLPLAVLDMFRLIPQTMQCRTMFQCLI